MKFVVTGGAGFIGSNIVKMLVRDSHEVIVIDNLHTGNLSRLEEVKNEIEFHNIDIRNLREISKVINNVNGIFHQAALTLVPESFEKPEQYYDVNVNGTKNIFEIAKKNNIKVVFASSSSVYGNVDKIPIMENFPRNPINPYGITKLEKEKLAKKFSDENCNIIGLRYFNVYGKGQTGTYAGVITQFLKKLESNLPPIIHGKGEQIRDFVFVEDVAEANITAMLSNTVEGFFNIGTGKAISILELAKIMIKISSSNINPEFDEPLQGDIEKSQADTNLAKNKIGWKYRTELTDGLEKFMR